MSQLRRVCSGVGRNGDSATRFVKMEKTGCT